MGYLCLLTALFAGAVKGYCGKKTSGYVSETKDAVAANFMRMVLCVIIGFAVLAVQGNLELLRIDGQIFVISLISGFTTAVFVVCWLLSVKQGAYMMVDTFLMLGVLVTLILSKIFFCEDIGLKRWCGIIVLLAAVLLMCSYNNKIKAKISMKALLLLIVCGTANGITDFSQKLFVKVVENGNVAVFNFYTYVFAAASLLLIYPLLSRNSKSNTLCSLKKIGIYIAVMSVCLFLNSYFKTVAAVYIPAPQLYPLNQGSALIISSVMASVLFKERLTVRAVSGICLAFVGLLIINVL